MVKIKKVFCVLMAIFVLGYSYPYAVKAETEEKPKEAKEIVIEDVELADTLSCPKFYTIDLSEPQYSIDISEEEINMLAVLAMAEAGTKCEEGIRLVIDTVLNRVDSPYFPNTVYDVINQPNQFSPMHNGAYERCYVDERIRDIVIEELISRYNYDVVFFRANHYGNYGVPMFEVGGNYFSSYS